MVQKAAVAAGKVVVTAGQDEVKVAVGKDAEVLTGGGVVMVAGKEAAVMAAGK